MDPVTVIVSALAAGASVALKSTAETVIKDAYNGFKALIQRKFGKVDVAPVEARPESEAKRASVAEDLKDAGADQDAEVLDAATKLLALLEQHAPAAGQAIGVDISKAKTRGFEIRDIVASGGSAIGVRLSGVEATEDTKISGVRTKARGGDPGAAPNPR